MLKGKTRKKKLIEKINEKKIESARVNLLTP
jgi:hypothetical protein